MRLTVITACAMICLATSANAQENTYKLTGKPKVFTVGGSDAGISIEVPGAGTMGKLTIECDGNVFVCTKVTLGGEAGENLTKKSATAKAATFEIPGGSGETSFNGTVIYDGTESTNTLTFASTAVSGQTTKSGEAQLGEWLATPCEEEGVASRATFLTTPFGRVIKQTKARITDRDRITVSVLAVSNLESILSVKEGSDLATPSVTNIYGKDVPIFKPTSKTTGERVRRVQCVITTPAPLGPFASPKGVVNINAHLGLEEKKVGTFQFQVNPTYTGAFSLGGGITTVLNPTFEKSFNGTDTVIVKHGRHRRFLYVATYTPYIWGPRDLSFVRGLDPRLYPFVGVVLNDIANNALTGVSIELQPGFAFVFAQHLARVNLLDTSTGAGVGKAFKGGTIPTDQRWVSKPFYGVIIDAHAAAGLIKSILAPK